MTDENRQALYPQPTFPGMTHVFSTRQERGPDIQDHTKSMSIDVTRGRSGVIRTYRSCIEAPVDHLIAWHTNPGAFQRLTPPWMPAHLLAGDTDTSPGSSVTLRVPVAGPIGFRWILSHETLESGSGFADVQRSGPFRTWRHEHRFEHTGHGESILEDRLIYDTPLGALGDSLVGTRLDTLFAFRHMRTRMDIQRHRATGLEKPMKVVISGASGLVGTRLTSFLLSGGHDVYKLVRRQPEQPDEIFWDPANGQIDDDALEGMDAVVHLAGASIAGGRWTDARKKAIRESRIKGTSLLATTLANLEAPPKVLVATSAVGYYGDRGDTKLTEESGPGEGFLADVVKAWESAADPAREAGIRVVHPRFGIVFAGEGGMLPILGRIFKAGIGGQLGDGEQYMAWIGIEDLVAILQESVVNENFEGPVNAVAPQQVTNKEFTHAMGSVLGRPTIFRVPAFAMKLVAGELADELILASQRVIPEKLTGSGFDYAFPTLEETLRQEFGRERDQRQTA